jgi:LacI family transcriptional regulator
MKKKVSLKDIALEVGVSTALVSYVLNNQKEGRIRKEVADRIRTVARDLNYTTNQIARSLKTSKTFTIGLIVADISNPFSSALARIIEDEAEKNNYTVIFGSSHESTEKLSRLLNVFVNRQVDGLIIAAVENSMNEIIRLRDMEVPFVLIDRYFPELNVSHVAIDNYKAAYSAITYIIDKGYKRIGMVTYKSSLFHLQERARGYISALKESGIPYNMNWMQEVRVNNTREDVEHSIRQLISQPEPVEAILFASNLLSIHALKHINTLSIKVPEELAIMSFDESDASYLFYAPLTHIRQPIQEMGQQATKILLESIDDYSTLKQVNLDTELVIGKSTLVEQSAH